MHEQDLNLARQAASGDPEAVRRLADGYGALLERAARRVLGASSPDGVTSAEDVVGEVFIRLLERRGALLLAYRGESSLAAYLVAVARRVAIDARRRGRPASPLPSEGAAADAPEDPPERLAQALAALPEQDRRILTLRYMEGMSYRGMATLLALPMGTVATWLSRARERLHAEWRRKTGGA